MTPAEQALFDFACHVGMSREYIQDAKSLHVRRTGNIIRAYVDLDSKIGLGCKFRHSVKIDMAGNTRMKVKAIKEIK
jgi:hypothetical protein